MASNPVKTNAVKVVTRVTWSNPAAPTESPVRTKSGIMVRPRAEEADERPPISEGARNAALVPLVDAMPSEIDTAHNPSRRVFERVPEVTVVLTNGAELRGVPLDYSTWQRILMLRTEGSDALHIPALAIVSVTVHVSPENEAVISRRGSR